MIARLAAAVAVGVGALAAVSASAQSPSTPPISLPVAGDYNVTSPLLTDAELQSIREANRKTCGDEYDPECLANTMMDVEMMSFPGRDIKYRSECDAGDMFGCTVVGIAYLDDSRIIDDPVRKAAAARNALVLLAKACDAKSAVGCEKLAMSYGLLAMHGLAPDFDAEGLEAATYQRSCQLGGQTACIWLGDRLRDGAKGVTTDRMAAAAAYFTSCQTLNREGCERLWSLFTGSGRGATFTEVEADRFLADLKGKCAASDWRACFVVADLETAGPARLVNREEGMALFEKGCTGGDISTCQYLASIYGEGSRQMGIRPDRTRAKAYDRRATELLAQACKAGDERACHAQLMIACDKNDMKACREAGLLDDAGDDSLTLATDKSL